MKRTFLTFALLFAVSVVAAQDEDAKIKAILEDRNVSLSFSQQKLSIVLKFFHDISGVKFLIDEQSPGVGDLNIDIQVANAIFMDTLKTIAVKYNIAFCVKNGFVIFGTKERIDAILGKVKKDIEGADLKAGEVQLSLKDGSKVIGSVALTELKFKTKYGELTIPLTAIKRIRFAVSAKDEKSGEPLTQDEIETAEFTAVGTLLTDKFEVKTSGGTLSIGKADIVKLIFPTDASPEEKSFEIKITGDWIDTGIILKKGDKLKITASGQLTTQNNKCIFTPDGACEESSDGSHGGPYALHGKAGALLARIGEKGTPFKTGLSYEKEVSEEGKLYLKIECPAELMDIAKTLNGAYKVKVNVEK